MVYEVKFVHGHGMLWLNHLFSPGAAKSRIRTTGAALMRPAEASLLVGGTQPEKSKMNLSLFIRLRGASERATLVLLDPRVKVVVLVFVVCGTLGGRAPMSPAREPRADLSLLLLGGGARGAGVVVGLRASVVVGSKPTPPVVAAARIAESGPRVCVGCSCNPVPEPARRV